MGATRGVAGAGVKGGGRNPPAFLDFNIMPMGVAWKE